VATATCYTLRRLAARIQALTEQRQLQQQITIVLRTHAPQLLQRHGSGPDCAAALLITAADNPDRLHSEASFAALCGVSPVEASSGKTRRRRLNRGGDGRANAALHDIALTRAPGEQCTRDYLDWRIAQGKPAAKPPPASDAASPARSTISSHSSTLQNSTCARLDKLAINAVSPPRAV
jgi:transposase